MAASKKKTADLDAAQLREYLEEWHPFQYAAALFVALWLVWVPLHLVPGVDGGWRFGNAVIILTAVAFAYVSRRIDQSHWCQQWAQILADAGKPAPPRKGALSRRKDWRNDERPRLRQAWLTACNTPAMQGKKSGDDAKTPPTLRNLRPTAAGNYEADITTAHGNGVTLTDIRANADRIAEVADATSFVIRQTGTSRAHVTWYMKDPIADVVKLIDVPDSPSGTLAYGVREDGTAAWIWAHMSAILFGSTGKGKSAMVRTLIAALQKQGIYADLYIADLKDGVQMDEWSRHVGDRLGFVKVARYVGGGEDMKADLARVEAMLSVIIREKTRRAGVMKAAHVTQHIPTEAEPLMIFIADETLPMADILKQGSKHPLGNIAFTGRAFGVGAWICCQLTDKSALGDLRDLVPQRVMFAIGSESQQRAGLGDGATINGARCHENPPPGVGWSNADNDPYPSKFRAAYVSDAEADDLADTGRLPEGCGPRLQAPERPCGVYVYPNVEGVCLYVGKAFVPKDRWDNDHSKKPWAGEVDWSRVRIYWRDSEAAALTLESELIALMQPRYNDQQNRDNPLRNDWRRDYQPLEPTLPAAVLEAEAKAARGRKALRPVPIKRTSKPKAKAAREPVSATAARDLWGF